MASLESTLPSVNISNVEYSRQQYVSQRIWACDPASSTVEAILARFPQRHSCQYCLDQIIRAFTVGNALLRDVDGAINAADDGCTFYEWLLDFVIRSRAGTDLVGEEGLFMRCKSFPDAKRTHPDAHSVQFNVGTIWYSWPCASFDIFTEEDNAAAEHISSRPFNTQVDSDSAYYTAKNWLVECHESHHHCQSPVPGFLPTRLVDLKNFGVVDSVKIVPSQLFITSTRPYRSIIGAVYTTLSYCWGGDQPTKTLKSNFEQHLIGIPISKLSQTLQDAIKVTRSLGIRFLWVDSLCIIQDDPQDIATEIAKMSDYYENSFVSISAAVAASCEEGFLKPRTDDPYLYGPFELPYRGFSGDPLGSVKLVKYLNFSSSLEPIRARAWILQEYLMAPRILSYGSRSLAWSCRTVNHTDGGPAGEYYDFEDRKKWSKLQLEKMPGQLFQAVSRWKDIIRSYTARALTVSDDKLPAISGIAQEFGQVIELYVQRAFQLRYSSETNFLDHDFVEDEVVPCPEYVGGLWYFQPSPPADHYFFHNQLLWNTSLDDFRHVGCTICTYPSHSRSSRTSAPRRNKEYRAPSWSWAAINGSINFEGQDHGGRYGLVRDSNLTIKDCRVYPEMAEAPYGTVVSGFLTVQGSVAEAPTTSSGRSIVYRLDTYDDLEILSQIIGGELTGWILQISTSGIPNPKPSSSDRSWSSGAPKGLLLVRSGANYRRIGLYSIENGPESHGLLQTRSHGFFRAEEPLFSDELRIITIV